MDYTKVVERGFLVLCAAWPTWYMDPRATDLKWNEVLGFVGDENNIFNKYVDMKNSAGNPAKSWDHSVRVAHGWQTHIDSGASEADRRAHETALTNAWQARIKRAREEYEATH
jgi:hypothetical protein